MTTRSRPIDAATFSGPIPIRQFIVDPLIPTDMITSLYGDGGSGKSWLSIQLAFCVATGTPWLGIPVTKGPVLYIDWETDVVEFHIRAKTLYPNTPIPSGVYYYSLQESIDRSDVATNIKYEISTINPVLVIVDSIGASMEGNSNDAKDVGDYFRIIRAFNCTCLLIDHKPKGNESQIGSVYKRNNSRSQIYIQKHPSSTQTKTVIIVEQTKSNSTAQFPEFSAEIDFSNSTVVINRINTPLATSIDQLIIAELISNGPLSVADLVLNISRNNKTVANSITKLMKSQSPLIYIHSKQGHTILYSA